MAEAAETHSLRLATPVRQLPGVGEKRAAELRRLGIETINDLIRHLPMRYERHQAEGGIDDLTVNTLGSVRGWVARCRWVGGGSRGKGRFEATLRDEQRTLALTWFNAPHLRGRIKPGMFIRVEGKVALRGDHPQMINPQWEDLTSEIHAPARPEHLKPIYPATEELRSDSIEQLIRGILSRVLDRITDPLPESLRSHHVMPTLAEAYRMIHAPEHEEEAEAARRRLAYNELLLLQLGIALKRHHNEHHLEAPPLRWSEAIDHHIRARFPFELTESQQQVIDEIARDLQKSHPMNRLLQGDVGSGKTVVALYAMLQACAQRYQAALMAPTELLAEQHYLSITAMLEGSSLRIALLTAGQGSAGSRQRQALNEQIAEGQVDIIIGTQALVASQVAFANLGVVVIDEQHRFGVLQRAAFRQAAGTASDQEEPAGASDEDEAATATAPSATQSPHYLVMTATPIPRTLSMTVFGDLDVSTIRGMPPGRQPPRTRVVPPEKADSVYQYIAEHCRGGEQAYVVVPTIDESGHESAVQLKSVLNHAQFIQDKFGAGLTVAALHGRMHRSERERIMQQFREGGIDIIVATTVIEVGVDVPNATMMVVEHAERFGLAQLHQLRGRIGRGEGGRRSVCVFIADPATESAQSRMAAIENLTDGFAIAEKDLEIRGMGDFFGTRQHGLPPLRVASFPKHLDLLALAGRDAAAIVKADPMMTEPGHRVLRKLLLDYHGEALGLVDVG